MKNNKKPYINNDEMKLIISSGIILIIYVILFQFFDNVLFSQLRNAFLTLFGVFSYIIPLITLVSLYFYLVDIKFKMVIYYIPLFIFDIMIFYQLLVGTKADSEKILFYTGVISYNISKTLILFLGRIFSIVIYLIVNIGVGYVLLNKNLFISKKVNNKKISKLNNDRYYDEYNYENNYNEMNSDYDDNEFNNYDNYNNYDNLNYTYDTYNEYQDNNEYQYDNVVNFNVNNNYILENNSKNMLTYMNKIEKHNKLSKNINNFPKNNISKTSLKSEYDYENKNNNIEQKTKKLLEELEGTSDKIFKSFKEETGIELKDLRIKKDNNFEKEEKTTEFLKDMLLKKSNKEVDVNLFEDKDLKNLYFNPKLFSNEYTIENYSNILLNKIKKERKKIIFEKRIFDRLKKDNLELNVFDEIITDENLLVQNIVKIVKKDMEEDINKLILNEINDKLDMKISSITNKFLVDNDIINNIENNIKRYLEKEFLEQSKFVENKTKKEDIKLEKDIENLEKEQYKLEESIILEKNIKEDELQESLILEKDIENLEKKQNELEESINSEKDIENIEEKKDELKESVVLEKDIENIEEKKDELKESVVLEKDIENIEEKKDELKEIVVIEKYIKNIEKKEDKLKEYVFPDISLLKEIKNLETISDEELNKKADELISTLKSFNVDANLENITVGPSVTRFEIQPKRGVKISKITGLSDDIKLNLAAKDIRIEAPIPGKSLVGIEVPNDINTIVSFRELVETDKFKNANSKLSFAVGKDISGKPVISDIKSMPHCLIAGATGAGKSVCINTLIMSILYKARPDEVKLIMIDPKVVELSIYNGIPHLLIPVVTDPKKAAGALNWAVLEMNNRYKLFANLQVRDIEGYNKKIKNNEEYSEYKKLPHIVIIVDELSDLMMACANEVEDAICRLAQMARASGIHLIIATQRPSVNVITGLIKANVPSRIAFSVSSAVDSRTIIDSAGAEKLLGKGDMLFYPQGYIKPVRVQGAYISDKEVSEVVDFLRENALAENAEELMESISSLNECLNSLDKPEIKEELDEYFFEAAREVVQKKKASIGMLQRKYKIGFNRAGRIMDQLFNYGIVGNDEGTKPRNVLVTLEDLDEMFEKM